MSSVGANLLRFLIDVLFDLYIGAVVLRLLLAWVRADFYNPLSQFLVTVTNPLLVPLRRIVPPLGRLDTASVVLAAGLKLIQLVILSAIAGLRIPVGLLLWMSLIQLAELVVYIYTGAILIEVILSWVAPAARYQNPVASLVHDLNEPIMRPLRRAIPPIGMVDLSPLVALIGLQMILIVLRGLHG